MSDISNLSTVKVHNQLTGLSNDDHPQYVLVNGRTSDVVQINNTTASGTTYTGALVVAGGVGVGGSLCVGGSITVPKVMVETSPVNQTDVVRLADVTDFSKVKAHNQLTGLSNDDHTQYCLVNGRTSDVLKVTNTTDSYSSWLVQMGISMLMVVSQVLG